ALGAHESAHRVAFEAGDVHDAAPAAAGGGEIAANVGDGDAASGGRDARLVAGDAEVVEDPRRLLAMGDACAGDRQWAGRMKWLINFIEWARILLRFAADFNGALDLVDENVLPEIAQRNARAGERELVGGIGADEVVEAQQAGLD